MVYTLRLASERYKIRFPNKRETLLGHLKSPPARNCNDATCKAESDKWQYLWLVVNLINGPFGLPIYVT